MKKSSSSKKRQLLVIASYPPQGSTHHKSVIGGASYTKETLTHLVREIKAKKETPEIIVLAEKMKGEQKFYKESDIQIYRMWSKGSILTPWILFREIRSREKFSEILIELELTMFGNNGVFLTGFLLLTFLLRLFNKRVTIVFHQVITDFHALAPHLNIRPRSWQAHYYSLSLRLFYTLLLKNINRAIVFEEILKKRLLRYTTDEKVTVIPLAVTPVRKQITKSAARKKLALKSTSYIVTSFGFLAWYKGSDWLVKAFENKKPRGLRLIMAGGPNPNRLSYPFYQRYLKELTRIFQKSPIMHTGFVDEEQMELYFAASDLILFPYRAIISSSYPLALAFSYNKPVLLSQNIAGILQSSDFNETASSVGLQQKSLFAPLSDEFLRQITRIKKDPGLSKKLILFSKKMAQKRSWKNIQKLYYAVFFKK